MSFALYLPLLAVLILLAPASLAPTDTHRLFFVLGWIGVWRWGWGFVHLGRALCYRLLVFPRWRAQADGLAASAADEILVPEVFIVVTSFRIPAETSIAAFSAAILEAGRYPNPVTIVAAVAEMADQRLVKDLFRRLAPPPRVRLVLVRGSASGKRDALAQALRAVSRAGARPDGVVLVQDGDTVLPEGCLARALPFFRLFPGLGALTTDEDCLVPRWSKAMRAWHRLRFAQRHQLMSSMALSRRLITLTGRMSAYRAGIATDPGFLAAIDKDVLDHWRFGRLRLLTGEDKSAAWWLLARGRPSLYLPDLQVLTIEDPPARDLLRASTALMLRWFGNMLRASGRCLALGPRRTGWFVWWCLLDQRASMWTPLVGPVAVAVLAVTVSPALLYAYLVWVLATRLGQSLLLLTARPRIDPRYPLLLYYSQVYGALLKTWVLFRLDRQRWTRQNIASAAPLAAGPRRLQAVASFGLHALALATLVSAVALSTGVAALPDVRRLAGLF